RSRCLQELIALLPVARAQFVGLERVEHPQHLLGITSDVQVVNGRESDYALRVDDEGGAQCHAFLLVENAERLVQFTLDVRKHREGEVLQIRVRTAPGQVDEFAVRGGTPDDRVAIGKLALQLSKSCNFRGAYEGKVLRPKE